MHIHYAGQTLTIGRTNLGEVLTWFADASQQVRCQSGCHREVHLVTGFGRIRMAFNPDRLMLFVVDLNPTFSRDDILADYPDHGPGQEHVHEHNDRRHVFYERIGLTMSLNDDQSIGHLAFGLGRDQHALA
jgi:hypothetical protein